MDIDLMLHHNETDSEVASQVMKRIRLNKESREVIVEDWPNEGNIPMMNTMDFPAINMKYQGYKNRYAYGWVGIDYWRQTLVKKTWRTPLSRETFLHPIPTGTAEDDGVLITIVFDGEREKSYVLVLDGQTFTEINHSYLPYNVLFSFHGNWFPELH